MSEEELEQSVIKESSSEMSEEESVIEESSSEMSEEESEQSVIEESSSQNRSDSRRMAESQDLGGWWWPNILSTFDRWYHPTKFNLLDLVDHFNSIFKPESPESDYRSSINSFEFGKSGNAILDRFIEEKKLLWIPFDQLKNVEYLDKGGFGTIYKAIWLSKSEKKDLEVALKCHNNMNENLEEFMTEWNYYELCITMRNINLYGFTMNPDTSNYMVIMDYADKGNLRENLTKIIKKNWKDKLFMLNKIINGLNVIHMQNIIHYGFHDGNILVKKGSQLVVSDLGLCQTVNFLKKNDIFGVIPFIAPEVLRGKPYTQASDIYSFSMIMWEFTSGIPPFNDRAHDFQLALSICKGERPKIIENTPQCYVDLMKKCWNEDPLKRPSTPEVTDIIRSWIFYPEDENLTEELINIAMKFIDAPIECNNFTTESHPQAYYKSRLQDFTSEKLNEILENKHSDYIITDKSSEKLNEVVESKF